MDFREIKIPVPWGYIAGKAWGAEKDPLVLCIHGWTDNANSFDTLMPLLPHSYYYVCIDLPSHGKSTELQASIFVHQTDLIVAVKLVYDYFNRQKIILLGHSMGGCHAISFTHFFPECVSKLIILDVYFSYPKSPANAYKLLGQYIKAYVAYAKKTKHGIRPTYTKEDAVKRLIAGRMTPISQKSAEILVERALTQQDGKYLFTVPQNIKAIILYGKSIHALLEIIKAYPIQCPHLMILSTKSSAMRCAFKDVQKEYEKNKTFELHIVEGNHDVHLENPERVAPLLTDFLFKYCSKL